MLDHTNIMPIVAIKRGFLLITATLATNEPSAKEPVSPINTFAGDVLKIKYPRIPPTAETLMAVSENNCSPCSGLTSYIAKYWIVSTIANTIKYQIDVTFL